MYYDHKFLFVNPEMIDVLVEKLNIFIIIFVYK